VVILEKPLSFSSARGGQRGNDFRGEIEQHHLPFANFPGKKPGPGMMNRLRMMIRIFPA
jgi:hypothetical protein